MYFIHLSNLQKILVIFLYEYEDEDEWVVSWDYMLKEYSLTDNKWLCSIFDVKEK